MSSSYDCMSSADIVKAYYDYSKYSKSATRALYIKSATSR